MIAVNCSTCGNRAEFPDNSAGKTARCGQCSEAIRIPLPAEIAELARKHVAAKRDEPDEEPWFYGFVESYGRICLVLTLLLGLPAAIFISMQAFSAGPIQGAAVAAICALSLLLAILPVAVAFIAVDTGRNVRKRT